MYGKRKRENIGKIIEEVVMIYKRRRERDNREGEKPGGERKRAERRG